MPPPPMLLLPTQWAAELEMVHQGQEHYPIAVLCCKQRSRGGIVRADSLILSGTCLSW